MLIKWDSLSTTAKDISLIVTNLPDLASIKIIKMFRISLSMSRYLRRNLGILVTLGRVTQTAGHRDTGEAELSSQEPSSTHAREFQSLYLVTEALTR